MLDSTLVNPFSTLPGHRRSALGHWFAPHDDLYPDDPAGMDWLRLHTIALSRGGENSLRVGAVDLPRAALLDLATGRAAEWDVPSAVGPTPKGGPSWVVGCLASGGAAPAPGGRWAGRAVVMATRARIAVEAVAGGGRAWVLRVAAAAEAGAPRRPLFAYPLGSERRLPELMARAARGHRRALLIEDDLEEGCWLLEDEPTAEFRLPLGQIAGILAGRGMAAGGDPTGSPTRGPQDRLLS